MLYIEVDNKMLKSKGFTLIELVVVIVILGILSAVAAPRFINLKSDAQTAALEGIKGALHSVIDTAHAKLVIKGVDKQMLNSATTPKVNEVIEGCTGCTFGFGYPAPDDKTLSVLVDGIGLNFEDDFVVTTFASNGSDNYSAEIAFADNVDTSTGKLINNTCYVKYTMSMVGLGEPTIELVECE